MIFTMDQYHRITVLMYLILYASKYASVAENCFENVCAYDKCWESPTSFINFTCPVGSVIDIHTAKVGTPKNNWTPGSGPCPLHKPEECTCTLNSTPTYELCHGTRVCNMSDEWIKFGQLPIQCKETLRIDITYKCERDPTYPTSETTTPTQLVTAQNNKTDEATNVPTLPSSLSSSQTITKIITLSTSDFPSTTDGKNAESSEVQLIAGAVGGAIALIVIMIIIIVVVMKRKSMEKQNDRTMIAPNTGNNKMPHITNTNNGFTNTYTGIEVRNEDTVIIENINYGSYDDRSSGNKHFPQNDEDTEIVDNNTYHTIVGDNRRAREVSPPCDDGENELLDNMIYHTVTDNNKENESVNKAGEETEMFVNENYSSYGDVDDDARDENNIPRPTMTKSSDDIIDPLHSDETTQRKIGPKGDLYTTVVGPFNE